METATMGKVLVAAKMENLCDLYQAERGTAPADQVRSVEVSDALVATGTIYLSLPKRLIDQLGLERFGTRRVRTSAGVVEKGVYDAVRLTVQGRDCTADVLEIPDDCPVLIGQVPLELLDFVVDPVNGKLIGNPAHGGEHMIDSF
jgi:predicted aspartyl protease